MIISGVIEDSFEDKNREAVKASLLGVADILLC